MQMHWMCAAGLAVLLAMPVQAETKEWLDDESLREQDLEQLIPRLEALVSSANDEILAANRQTLRRVETEGANHLFGRACALLARTLYWRSEAEAALATLQSCLEGPAADADRSGYVMLRTALSSMLLVNGRPDEARASFESVLAEDLGDVDPVVVRRLRGNYAASLKSLGDDLNAMLILTEVLDEALEQGDAHEQTHFGNNLVVILEEQGMYRHAALWVERLDPAMQALPDYYPVRSLKLHEIQLRGILGANSVAIPQLQDYIKNGAGDSPAVLGNAYEYLSDMQFESRDYQAAKASAQQAIDILQGARFELGDAQLAMARVCIELNDLDQADELLSAVARDGHLLQATSQDLLNALQLRLALLRNGSDELMGSFDRFNEQREQISRDRQERYTRYFDAQLEASRQARRVEELESQQALLEAQAEADRQTRNLTLVSAFSGVVFFLLVMYLWIQRRFEGEFRTKQVALTAELETEVEVQSKALAKRAHREALGQLTGNVAHDFNNLLQVMSIANERVASESITEASRRLLHGSNEALSSARGIISRLLAYARQQELDARPLGFAEFLNDTRPLLEAALGSAFQLQVVDRVPVGLGIRVDKAHLTSAMINLLTNAAQAKPDSGEVHLSFDVIEHVPASAGDEEWDLASGNYVEIAVTDDGTGMNEAEMLRATEPFFSTRTATSGTGLGLSSVYGFARQSGGDLHIRSAPQQGTTVHLRFPVVSVHAAGETGVASRSVSLVGKHALVVEDNRILGESLLAMLDYIGLRTRWVTSGEAAVELLKASDDSIDLVISDVRMPGEYDGLLLASWVEEHFPDLKILLISGFSDVERIDRPLLHKPFTEAELRNAIDGLLTQETQLATSQ